MKYYSVNIGVRLEFQYLFYVPVFIEDTIFTSTSRLIYGYCAP